MLKQFELYIRGRVQGVGFRHAASQKARTLGLRGSIENKADGSVFSVINGSEENCLSFIRWCHRGPGYSWVEKVDVKDVEPGPQKPFRVIY